VTAADWKKSRADMEAVARKALAGITTASAGNSSH
jgi:hypothetical protein